MLDAYRLRTFKGSPALARQFCTSLILSIKGNGPKIVPWRMPHVREVAPEKELFTEHLRVRLCKYDLNHSCVVPEIPLILSLDRRILWSTVSKVFFRSKNTTALTLPLSIFSTQLSVRQLRLNVKTKNPIDSWILNCIQLDNRTVGHKWFSQIL